MPPQAILVTGADGLLGRLPVRKLVPGAGITVPPPDGPLTGGLLDGARAARDLGYTPAYNMRHRP